MGSGRGRHRSGTRILAASLPTPSRDIRLARRGRRERGRCVRFLRNPSRTKTGVRYQNQMIGWHRATWNGVGLIQRHGQRWVKFRSPEDATRPGSRYGYGPEVPRVSPATQSRPRSSAPNLTAPDGPDAELSQSPKTVRRPPREPGTQRILGVNRRAGPRGSHRTDRQDVGRLLPSEPVS